MRSVALIGCGRWGTNHLQVLQKLRAQGMVGRLVVCDIDATKLKTLKADAVYASSTVMFANETLDAVAIVTPPSTHVPLLQTTAETHLPVLVEKPLSDQHLVAADYLGEGPLPPVMVVGYILRHHPGLQHLHQLIASETMGSLRRVAYIRTTTRQRPKDATPLSTLAVHGLDAVAWLLAQPLMKMETRQVDVSSEAAHIILHTHNETLAEIEVSWGAQEERRLITVEGANGTMTLDFGSNTVETSIAPSVAKPYAPQEPALSPLELEWRYFLNAIENEKQHAYPPVEDLLDQSEWMATFG
jgi:predicted dehydrogenase